MEMKERKLCGKICKGIIFSRSFEKFYWITILIMINFPVEKLCKNQDLLIELTRFNLNIESS